MASRLTDRDLVHRCKSPMPVRYDIRMDVRELEITEVRLKAKRYLGALR